MITEQDLKEAIAECQGARNPNANTCIKLAAFLTIQRELFGTGATDIPVFSFANGPAERAGYESDTEFGRIVSGMRAEAVLSVMDELMQTIGIINPKLYESVMRKLVDM